MLSFIRQAIGNLALPRKLALLTGMLVVPVLVLAAMFISSQNVVIESTARQQQALRLVRPLLELERQISVHRMAALLALSGDGGTEPVRGAQAAVEAALAAAMEAQEASADQFGTASLLAEIREGWGGNLKVNWNTGANAALSLDMHTLLLAQVGDAINLISRGQTASATAAAGQLDRGLVFTLPAGVESLGQLGAFGALLSRTGTAPAVEQWDQLAVLMQEARRSNDGLRSAVVRMGKATASPSERTIRAAATQAIESAEAFLEAAQDGISRRDQFRVDTGTFRAQADRAASDAATLQNRLAEALDSELDAALGNLRLARNAELAAVVLLLGLALGLGYIMADGVHRQVRSVASVFERIKKGDAGARAAVINRDELGEFAASLNLVLDNAVALGQSRAERDAMQADIQRLLEEMEGVAQGDLTQEAEAGRGPTAAIARSFNVMLVELRGLINRVQESTSAVNAAAESAGQAGGRLVEGSESQSRQLLEATTAVDQVVQSIQQVTHQAATAAQIAQDALRNARLGAASAEQTIEGMGEVKRQVTSMQKLVEDLGTSLVQVGDITQLIADISKRTSVLALNASIQAAVAGQSGKGFGVVAEQVEELASRSSDAVRRVATLTKSIQAATGSVVEALDGATRQVSAGEELAIEARARLADIEAVSTRLNSVVGAILTACHQQSASSESIARSMGEMSREAKYARTTVEAATGSIEQLANLVEELRGSVSRFRLPA